MTHPLIAMIDRMMGCDPAKAGQESFSAVHELQANEIGEVKGIGPEWVCANYAEPGHDYGKCQDCYRNYEVDFLPRLKRGCA
ncbi:MAG TPA: hypothetical protein VN642_10315 [Dongiaceae bacterium]|nr:hypothetical protein [Dongiaceae bacterium]